MSVSVPDNAKAVRGVVALDSKLDFLTGLELDLRRSEMKPFCAHANHPSLRRRRDLDRAERQQRRSSDPPSVRMTSCTCP